MRPIDDRAGLFQSLDDGRDACRRRHTNQHFRPAKHGDAGFVEQVLYRNRDAGECVQLRAAATSRVHLVGGGKRFALRYSEEGARAFSLRVSDCRERLFDELTAGYFQVGETLRKVVNAQRGEFASRPALRESRIDTPKRRAGERKGAQAGGSLQKVSTILIHGYSLLLARILVQKKTMPAGVNRPILLICAETPDFPEMTGCRASAWAFGTLQDFAR